MPGGRHRTTEITLKYISKIIIALTLEALHSLFTPHFRDSLVKCFRDGILIYPFLILILPFGARSLFFLWFLLYRMSLVGPDQEGKLGKSLSSDQTKAVLRSTPTYT